MPSVDTAWSEWGWTEEFQCEHRYRQKKNGEWQFEYRRVVTSDEYSQRTPRGREVADPPTLAAIPEGPHQDYKDDNYNYNPVEELSKAVEQTHLSTDDDGQTTNQVSSPTRPFGRGFNSRPPRIPNNFPRKIFTQDPRTKVDLDPNYKVYKSKDFYFGRIFRVLWSEPHGSGGTELTGRHKSSAKYGEAAYHSIRRFLIVDPKKGHCICLPILTYGGQGTLKYGVHPGDHAMIHTQKSGAPDLLPHEQLTKKPIRVIISNQRYRLDPASRLNYAKIYTVEHNVKVEFVGHVEKKYEQTVVTVYNSLHTLPNRPIYPEDTEDVVSQTQGQEPVYPVPVPGAQSWVPNSSPQISSPYGSPASYPQPSMYQPAPDPNQSGVSYAPDPRSTTQRSYEIQTPVYPLNETENTMRGNYPAAAAQYPQSGGGGYENPEAPYEHDAVHLNASRGAAGLANYDIAEPAHHKPAESPYLTHAAAHGAPGGDAGPSSYPSASSSHHGHAAAPRPSSGGHSDRARPCLRCVRKDYRCDRRRTCTNCARARTTCTYEPDPSSHVYDETLYGAE